MAQTTYQVIFNSFLSKVHDDDWFSYDEDQELLYAIEWTALLHNAMALFKFPRFNTIMDDENQVIDDELTNEEIEILAHLMKQEWLDQLIHSWEQVRMLYDERDFSPANMLAQLIKAEEHNEKKTRERCESEETDRER